jgi:hypothetical protein
MRPSLLRLALVAVAASSAACASNDSGAKSSAGGAPKSEFALPGKRVYVEYRQWNGPTLTTLALVNRGSTDPTEVYRNPPSGVLLKVASDDDMADLCEAFRRLKFDGLAGNVAPDARSSMRLDVDGRSSAVARTPQNAEAFGTLRDVFMVVYNHTTALYTTPNAKGRALFEREQERIGNETVRKKGLGIP